MIRNLMQQTIAVIEGLTLNLHGNTTHWGLNLFEDTEYDFCIHRKDPNFKGAISLLVQVQ